MNKLMMTILAVMLSLGPVAHANDAPELDGLVKTKVSVARDAWVAPDVDFSAYTKIMLEPAEFEFREVKKTSRLQSFRGNRNEFYIEERDRERLIETVTKIFAEELGKVRNFEFVTEPGEDVLVLRGGLKDIVSRVLPEMIGPGKSYVRTVGEATLVLEVTDSTTGETLFRAADRRKIERPGLDLIEANSVATGVEVRRWATRWATALRSDLDAVHT